MKWGFYPKLAASGIGKNKRMFLPYILTCTGMVTMFYIILFLAVSDVLSPLIGADAIREIFSLGSWVIAIFAGIFLFYTNSFLMRRRKKEFGLYNMLGMGKGNIARILLWEHGIIAVLSIGMGLLGGMLLSKLAELGLIYVIHGEVTYDLSVSVLAIKRSVQVFGVIFVLLLLNSIRQVRFSSAVELMRSEKAGEKPPKGNWAIGLLGLLILGVAYYMAATIKNPLTVIALFFFAVVLVVIATYLIMISGSVLFCRLLQKKKSYYYQPNHFVSLSSMVYRMKRNGAGLASICILATMVLVTIAFTACLYFGEQDAIQVRYPREINMEFRIEHMEDLQEEAVRQLQERIAEELETHHIRPQNDYAYRSANIYGQLWEGIVELDPSGVQAADAINAPPYLFYFVSLEDYNRVMGAHETLHEGEVLLYSNRVKYSGQTIAFRNGPTFQVKGWVEQFIGSGDTAMDIVPSILLVVPDLESSVEGADSLANFLGDRRLQLKWLYHFDTGTEPEQQIALYYELADVFSDVAFKRAYGYTSCRIDSQEYERNDFYGLFGTLFYIGILLSIVFLIAAVLIIYYKQISEGYEDQARFEIMQKVGMTKREIRKSINSQLLTVFFLPLAFAALHLAFAFPMVSQLLLAFNLNNILLFAATTGISFVAFSLFYMLVYRITSNAYYHIVSGAKGSAF